MLCESHAWFDFFLCVCVCVSVLMHVCVGGCVSACVFLVVEVWQLEQTVARVTGGREDAVMKKS